MHELIIIAKASDHEAKEEIDMKGVWHSTASKHKCNGEGAAQTKHFPRNVSSMSSESLSLARALRRERLVCCFW